MAFKVELVLIVYKQEHEQTKTQYRYFKYLTPKSEKLPKLKNK